jgi:hypothetical protein
MTSSNPNHDSVRHWLDWASRTVSALVWPLAVLIIIAVFHAPLLRLLEVTPDQLGSASTIHVGTVELNFAHTPSPPPKVGEALRSLTPGNVERLLKRI